MLAGFFLPNINGEIKKEDFIKQGVNAFVNTKGYMTAIIRGKIANTTYMENFVLFDAVNLKVMTFFPFSINTYSSGKFVVLDYVGFFSEQFTFILCIKVPYKSIQMNVQTKNPVNHSITWMVVSTSGNIATNEILWILTNESSYNLTGTYLKINDTVSLGSLTAGDTIEVQAASPRLYCLTIKDKNTALIMCNLT